MKIPKKFWQQSVDKWEKIAIGDPFDSYCGYCDFLKEKAGVIEKCKHCSLAPIVCGYDLPDNGENKTYWYKYLSAERKRTKLKYARLILAAIKDDGRKWGYLK